MNGDHVSAIFTMPARRQYQLDVEAALALSQGEFGIIPPDCARTIARNAHLNKLSIETIELDQDETGHSLVPLIRELARVAGNPAGGWVHWGVTTQNIEQTSNVLAIRDAELVIRARIERILDGLADLADKTADLPMPGRTHGQQAVPITFGFKIAAWIDVQLRNLQRLDELAPRLYSCMMGGAVGTFATFGAVGRDLQAAVSARLGLRSMAVSNRNIVDQFAELIFIHGLIAASASSIAEEVTRMMTAEFGEVSEDIPVGDIGSSTMPQKRNPKLCQNIIKASAEQRSLVPLAVDATIQAHEVDGARWAIISDASARSCILTDDLLTSLEKLVRGLHVYPERMMENLRLTGGLISAEFVMMRLASSVGHQTAHDIVHRAALNSLGADRPAGAFLHELLSEPVVSHSLTRQELVELLDPVAHLGLSASIAREAVFRVRQRERPGQIVNANTK